MARASLNPGTTCLPALWLQWAVVALVEKESLGDHEVVLFGLGHQVDQMEAAQSSGDLPFQASDAWVDFGPHCPQAPLSCSGWGRPLGVQKTSLHGQRTYTGQAVGHKQLPVSSYLKASLHPGLGKVQLAAARAFFCVT